MSKLQSRQTMAQPLRWAEAENCVDGEKIASTVSAKKTFIKKVKKTCWKLVLSNKLNNMFMNILCHLAKVIISGRVIKEFVCFTLYWDS